MGGGNGMRRQFGWWVVLALASFLIFGSVPPALAKDVVASAGRTEKGAGITLEEAIMVAKRFVQVPDEYQNFQPGYCEGDEVFWELRWSSDNPEGGDVTARVNARTGELWGFTRWDPQPGKIRRGLPKLTRADAQEIACNFLKEALPGYFGNLQLVEDDSFPYISLRETATPSYNINFVRLQNGIPFRENSASVEVDANTGEILSFYFNWNSRLDFPKAEGVMEEERAKTLWRQNARVELIYVMQGGEDRKDATPRLVFAPGQGELMIDARTGEVLKPEDFYYGDLVGGAGGAESNAARRREAPLTPAEQAALDEMGKLIAKEKALDAARSLVGIPQGMELEGAELREEYFTGRKVWNFNWRNKKTEEGLNVRVDAVKGDVIGFRFFNPDPLQDKEPGYGEAQARKASKELLERVARGYLKELEELRVVPVPGRFPVVGSGAPEDPRPVGYRVTARRLVKGIPFINDGVEIYYDACQGRITSYELTWSDVDFPEARGVIGREQAENVLLGSDNLKLSYCREFPTIYNLDADRPLRLVYTLDLSKAPVYVDAFSGTGLGYDFQPKDRSGQVFSDLNGLPGAGEIDLLVKARVIPVYEQKFHPQEQLIQRDFLIWLVRATGWPSAPAGTPEKEFEKAYRNALLMGILKPGEEYLPGEPLSRLTMARLAVRAIGWEEAAQLSGIWSLPGTVKGLPREDTGYVALAFGLGVLDLAGKDVDLGAGLSRSDGALAIYRLLK
jgi:hypothetical protein